MEKLKLIEEQILFALRQSNVGEPVSDVCRQKGINEAHLLTLEEALRQHRMRWLGCTRHRYEALTPQQLFRTSQK